MLLVSLYRTPASLEAAWKYFILCGVGIAQALFGTILLYMASQKVLGSGIEALLWTHLAGVRSQLEPTVLSIAFVFLLVGYGTKVGLVPLHNWLPDAHAEGPTPVSAVLSGLLLNVALYALVRCKVLADGALGTPFAGQLMMGFGIASVVVAAFFLSRQRDIKRLFAYSSIEHMGLDHLRVRHGRPGRELRRAPAHDGALAHQERDLLRRRPRGAEDRHAGHGGHPRPDAGRARRVGWGLMIGTLAILGLPPFGVFASEFLILTSAMRQQPWAAPCCCSRSASRSPRCSAESSRWCSATPRGKFAPMQLPYRPALLPVFTHYAIVLALGLYVPPYLADWYREAARADRMNHDRRAHVAERGPPSSWRLGR